MSATVSTRSLVLCSLIVSLAAPRGDAQTNLIEEQLDAVREGFFELGPFHATPVLNFSTGYDSNALSTPNPQADVRAVFGPGLRLGLPMGSKAFLDVYQEVDFVYYREQVDLRQVFGVTRLGGGWGGRRYLFRVEDEFRDETTRPTSEFDFPVEQRSNSFEASLTMAVGWRHQLRARYEQHRTEIAEQSLDDPSIAERLNSVRDTLGFDFSRNLTAKTHAVANVFYEKMDFEDSYRNANSYGGLFGLDFSPEAARAIIPTTNEEPGMSGRFVVGFRRLVPLDADLVDYTGPIGRADVSMTSRSRHRVRGLFQRDVVPSILDENWYFVQNRFGGFFRWQVHERFSVEPGAVVGRNQYPLPRILVVDDEEIVEDIFDEHTSFLFTMEYNVRAAWFVGVTTEYLDRRSNVLVFDKDRLLVSFQLVLRP